MWAGRRTGQGGKDGQSTGRQLCQSGQGDADRRTLHALHQLLCLFFHLSSQVPISEDVLGSSEDTAGSELLLAVEVTRLSTEQ